MVWEPTSIIREEFGRLQIVVGGVDVTFFRNVPTQVQSWNSAEPFADSTAVIVFPQITPFERLGVIPLTWLKDFASVDINLVRPDTTVKTLWEGMIASIEDTQGEDDQSLQIICFGALFQLDLYVRAPLYAQEKVSVGDLFRAQFGVRPAMRTSALVVQDVPRENPNGPVPPAGEKPADEFKTKRTGSWNRVLTGFIQDELALLVTNEALPRQYTMMMNRPRIPVLRLKDYITVHATVSMGTPGISHSLKHDQTQSANVIYGEGTDQAGTVWRNSRRDPNITVYEPLVADERVHTFLDASNNPINPQTRNNDIVRVEIHYGYGAGVDFAQGVKSATAQLKRDSDAGWIGTITLRTDPQEGSRFEIEAGQNILYKHFRPGSQTPPLRALSNGLSADVHNLVFNQNVYIGTLFHIAGVQHTLDTLTTVLTVDTKSRDLLSLAELIDRQNEGHLDPSKRLRNGASDIVNDEKEPWDYTSGSGFIPLGSLSGNGLLDGQLSPGTVPSQYIHCPAKTWVVQQIRAATKASIMFTEIRAFTSGGGATGIPFHASFYGHSKVTSDFPIDPFAKDALKPNALNPAGRPSGFIVGWGEFGQRGGFSPGLDSEGGAPTGLIKDEGTWQFDLDQTLIEPGLFIALWANSECWIQGRLFQGVE